MNTECSKHHLPLVNFCPPCSQFMCCECECSHYKLMPIKLINKYLCALSAQEASPTQDQINATKKDLANSFIAEETKLKSAFSKAIDFLDTFVRNKSELEGFRQCFTEAGVSDIGFDAFNSMAVQKKAEDIALLPTKKSFQNYADKGKKIIGEISLITSQFNDLLDFLKVPPISISTTLHFWDEDVLTIIDTRTQIPKEISLSKEISKNTDSIACMGKLFFIGGENGSDVFELDIKTKDLIPKSSMIMEKSNHSLCTSDAFIYSIGGENQSTTLTDCEKYSVVTDKWMMLPNLQKSRSECGTCTMNNALLFAFAGNSKGSNCNSLEKLNLRYPQKWEIMVVANICEERSKVHASQITENEMIIFGGESNETWFGSYILKFSNEGVDCVPAGNLSTEAQFYTTSAPIFDGEYVYGVSNSCDVHRYSIKTKTWEMMDYPSS